MWETKWWTDVFSKMWAGCFAPGDICHSATVMWPGRQTAPWMAFVWEVTAAHQHTDQPITVQRHAYTACCIKLKNTIQPSDLRWKYPCVHCSWEHKLDRSFGGSRNHLCLCLILFFGGVAVHLQKYVFMHTLFMFYICQEYSSRKNSL